MGTWCRWLSRSLSKVSSIGVARGLRFKSGCVHLFTHRSMSKVDTENVRRVRNCPIISPQPLPNSHQPVSTMPPLCRNINCWSRISVSGLAVDSSRSSSHAQLFLAQDSTTTKTTEWYVWFCLIWSSWFLCPLIVD